MTTQKKDCAKREGEAEARGGIKGVVVVEATIKGRTRVAQKGEGIEIGTRIVGCATCTS